MESGFVQTAGRHGLAKGACHWAREMVQGVKAAAASLTT